MLRIKAVYMDYQERAMGTKGCPLFSWVLESDKKNVTQKAYYLVIKEGSQEIYNSGWVETAQSAHIKPDVVLKSLTKYTVLVQVKDKEEESPLSDPVFFITGILKKEEWQAKFISAEIIEDKDNSKGTYVRKNFQADGEIESAYVCTTALGLYYFYINGNKVGEDELAPGWTSYKKHLCYQTYEVTDYVKKGNNVFSAMIGAGWYKGKMGFLLLRNNYGERTAFFMQMVIQYKDGRKEVVVTDESWEGTDGPILFSEIYDGEIYDARKEIKDFSVIGKEKWEPVSKEEFPLEALTPQAGSRVKKMQEIPVKQVFVTPQGDTVLDFGQNLTGWVEVRVKAEEGKEIELQCFETLDADGNVYIDNLRTAKQTIKYISNGEERVYHPHFTFQGFQYVKVCKWHTEIEKLLPEDFRACVLYSEMEQTGTFSCSNPLVNQLQHNILWGLKGNFVDIPTDCPQRDERMGWTGDAQIFCRTACYLMNTDVFFTKWLMDLTFDQTEEGGVPHVVPDIVSDKKQEDWLISQGTHSAAAWADAAVINPWTLYLVYGDIEILKKQYESMRKWILFMKQHSKEYIWDYKRQFGDWLALDAEEGSYFGATPNEFVCMAYYAYSTGLFAKTAKILGREEDEREFSQLYQGIVEKFQKTYFMEDGRMSVQTQTAHVVALYFHLVPEQFVGQTAKRLTELLLERDGHLSTGFVGTPYICHALSENGYGKEAYQLLLKEDFPSWLYQVKMGATTIWEHWDGKKADGTMWSKDMNSFNHYAYGAVGDWLYRGVLGIDTDEMEPGYQKSMIKPQTNSAFTFAKGSFQSIYGKIAVDWKREGNKVTLLFEVPVNTKATILLEQGAYNVQADELLFKEEKGMYKAECGSGKWAVEYQKDS